MRRYLEIAVLIVYTLLNLKMLWPLLSEPGYLTAVAVKGTGSNYLAVFIGLFLNAALIIYYLRTHSEHK